MNVIEQHVELTEDVLTIPVLAEWRGKGATLKLTLDNQKAEPVPVVKPKTDLTRFGSKFADLPTEEIDRMLTELDAMRNEWGRDI